MLQSTASRSNMGELKSYVYLQIGSRPRLKLNASQNNPLYSLEPDSRLCLYISYMPSSKALVSATHFASPGGSTWHAKSPQRPVLRSIHWHAVSPWSSLGYAIEVGFERLTHLRFGSPPQIIVPAFFPSSASSVRRRPPRPQSLIAVLEVPPIALFVCWKVSTSCQQPLKGEYAQSHPVTSHSTPPYSPSPDSP
jgi:hypothetical protein